MTSTPAVIAFISFTTVFFFLLLLYLSSIRKIFKKETRHIECQASCRDCQKSPCPKSHKQKSEDFHGKQSACLGWHLVCSMEQLSMDKEEFNVSSSVFQEPF